MPLSLFQTGSIVDDNKTSGSNKKVNDSVSTSVVDRNGLVGHRYDNGIYLGKERVMDGHNEEVAVMVGGENEDVDNDEDDELNYLMGIGMNKYGELESVSSKSDEYDDDNGNNNFLLNQPLAKYDDLESIRFSEIDDERDLNIEGGEQETDVEGEDEINFPSDVNSIKSTQKLFSIDDLNMGDREEEELERIHRRIFLPVMLFDLQMNWKKKNLNFFHCRMTSLLLLVTA